MSQALIAKLRAQREGTVEVEPGVTLRFRRPIDGQMSVMRHLDAEKVCEQLVGWDGVTEALLLGAAVGSSDPLAFTPELALEVVGDRGEWLVKVSAALVAAVTAFYAQKADAAKN